MNWTIKIRWHKIWYGSKHFGHIRGISILRRIFLQNAWESLVLDNTRRARVAPKGLLCRVLTNHPAERQDTWVLDNYFQANLWSFPPRPSRGPVFGHLKHREPSQVYTKLVPIRIIFRFRDIPRTHVLTNIDFWSPLHNSPFGAITKDLSKLESACLQACCSSLVF